MLSRIWTGFGRVADNAHALADSLGGLADTFRVANLNIRNNLALDAAPPALATTPESLPAPPAPEEKTSRRKASA
jgi:hypothetical protein